MRCGSVDLCPQSSKAISGTGVEWYARCAPYPIHIIQDEYQCGRQKRERDGAAAGDVAREEGEECREGEDAELELDDEPLVLELELRLIGVADDVGGALQNDR